METMWKGWWMASHLFCSAINLRSVINKKKHSKTSRHNLRLPSNSRTVSHVLRRGAKTKLTSSFCTGYCRASHRPGLQFIQQIGVSGRINRKAKYIVTSSVKLRRSYKPLIARECSYSICPIQEREYKWASKLSAGWNDAGGDAKI